MRSVSGTQMSVGAASMPRLWVGCLRHFAIGSSQRLSSGRLSVGRTSGHSGRIWVSLFYEKALKVSFWDYRGLPGSIHGRICMPFSLAWGVLALPLIYWVHPALAPLVQAIPGPVSLSAVTAVGADSLISLALLAQTHDRSCLEWRRS